MCCVTDGAWRSAPVVRSTADHRRSSLPSSTSGVTSRRCNAQLHVRHIVIVVIIIIIITTMVAVWCSGSALVSINEVNLRRARSVLRWVTVSGFNSRCGTSISVCKQPPRSTQPGHPSVGRRNEYQPKGGDALRLGSKGRLVRVWEAGKTV